MRAFNDRKNSVQEHMENIQKRRRKQMVSIVSICLAVAVLSAVLFVPYDTTPPDVQQYAGSEYYAVIRQLSLATYEKPVFKNNFQAIVVGGMVAFRALGGLKAGNAAPGAKEEIISPTGGNQWGEVTANGTYEETTDNQVQGVIETDLMKRSDRYIFYLRDMTLCVYSIAGMESELVGSYEITSELDRKIYANNVEMFLSPDCNTVTLFMQVYAGADLTVVLNLDVSDPTQIKLKKEMRFSGRFLSARMVNGDVLLAYNYIVPGTKNINYDDPTTFVPQYGTHGNMQCIAPENIVCPETVSDARYTVICKLSGDTLAVEGTTALLGYSEELYVSQDTIYASHSYTQTKEAVYTGTQTAMTEITGISYAGDGLEILGTIALEGTIKNQYSMDQYEGILRVVTSTNLREYTIRNDRETVTISTNGNQDNVNLYCVDLSDWKIEASVIGFAPAGEEATSVRFDGTKAYVCTAEVIRFTDPVYFFDLSDLSNITYTDTGIIDGYSTSLIQLGNGYLMGIGYSKSNRLKIEIYENTEKGVVSVCVYERQATFSEDYKAYFVDRERQLIGLAVYPWDGGREYMLLHFDGEQMNVVNTLNFSGSMDHVRATLIDDYFYVLSTDFIVKPMD